MLAGLFLLLLCQLAGETIVRGLSLPIPGPVIGIVLLVAGLAVRHRRGGEDPAAPTSSVGSAADGLLRFLGLLFVPAGVGLAQSYDLVLANGVAIAAALIGSTFVTLLATVYTFRLVARLTGREASQ